MIEICEVLLSLKLCSSERKAYCMSLKPEIISTRFILSAWKNSVTHLVMQCALFIEIM